MKNILITGGAGFIGSHLADFLVEKGLNVTVFDDLSTGKKESINDKCTFIRGCVTDAQSLDRALENTDFCFHLAAVASVQNSIEKWVECHQVNLVGSINVFKSSASKGIPVVYASSAAVYGNPDKMPIKESYPAYALSPYGFDKYSSEYQALLFSRIMQLQSIGLRFFNVYGQRQVSNSPYSGVISVFIDHITSSKPISVYGDGKQARDFIYVGDVVDALYKSYEYLVFAGKGRAYEIFNICTGVPTTLNSLVDILFSVANQKVEVNYYASRQGDIYQSIGCPELAKKKLKFIAQTPLDEGLQHIVNLL